MLGHVRRRQRNRFRLPAAAQHPASRWTRSWPGTREAARRRTGICRRLSQNSRCRKVADVVATFGDLPQEKRLGHGHPAAGTIQVQMKPPEVTHRYRRGTGQSGRKNTNPLPKKAAGCRRVGESRRRGTDEPREENGARARPRCWRGRCTRPIADNFARRQRGPVRSFLKPASRPRGSGTHYTRRSDSRWRR